MTKQKKSAAKKIAVCMVIAVLIIAALIIVSPRLYPVWRPAQLTIRQSADYPESPYIDPAGTTLEERILPPEGFTRIEVSDTSFAKYLRTYPLLPNGSEIPLFDGSTRPASQAAAVFDVTLSDDGSQQCADSIICLYSDYFRQFGQEERIAFHFTNGQLCDYTRWRKGRRILAFGDFSVALPAAIPDKSEQQYRNYLKEVMRYAGTLSMMDESETVTPEELTIGDIICSPVHIFLIVDEAVSDTGERRFLIGQSSTPSISFHIINGKDGSPWYTQEQLSGSEFRIDGFSFTSDQLLRWNGGFDK